jgi:hypothetical protein
MLPGAMYGIETILEEWLKGLDASARRLCEAGSGNWQNQRLRIKIIRLRPFEFSM